MVVPLLHAVFLYENHLQPDQVLNDVSLDMFGNSQSADFLVCIYRN